MLVLWLLTDIGKLFTTLHGRYLLPDDSTVRCCVFDYRNLATLLQCQCLCTLLLCCMSYQK